MPGGTQDELLVWLGATMDLQGSWVGSLVRTTEGGQHMPGLPLSSVSPVEAPAPWKGVNIN